MIVGFTGTRHGMTEDQRTQAELFLTIVRPHSAHHGDCIGADAQFHELCLAAGVNVILRPPTDNRHRAFCEGAIRAKPPRPYLERDRDIVEAADVMLATPREVAEPPPKRGQGTWYTVRYARRQQVPGYIIWPDGSVTNITEGGSGNL